MVVISRCARCLVAVVILTVPVLWPSAAAAQDPGLGQIIAKLPVATEQRAGYERSLFRHWIDVDDDGCTTRDEVLIAEAITPAQVGPECAITGGSWYSYYDDTTVATPGELDVDHMVPLAESWVSGAHAWGPDRRRAFANDLESSSSLVAVTASANRSKSDSDPAGWLPPHAAAVCRYVTDWVDVKLRWQLHIDPAERDALLREAARCPG